MTETQRPTSPEQDPPLFSDLRPQLYAELPDSQPLFDPASVDSEPRQSAPRLLGHATAKNSGLIDLGALTGAKPWTPYASTVGTLVGDVAQADAAQPTLAFEPKRSPSKLRRWLLGGGAALFMAASLYPLVA